MTVQLGLAICDMSASLDQSYKAPKYQLPWQAYVLWLAVGQVWEVVRPSALRKRDIRSQGCAEQQIALYPHRTDVAKFMFQVPSVDFFNQ